MKNAFLYSLLSLLIGIGASGCGSSEPTLNIGDVAPDFSLQSDDGRTIKLSDYREKTVVLFFYPKDETPGCTKEACGFRDSFSAFKDAGIEVFGVSVDGVESHQKFREKEKLNFTLLSDDKKEVSKKYGVLGGMGLSQRVTFIIGKNGVIKKIFRDVKPESHAQEVLVIAKAI
ncbi:MAG: hypothetical protein HY22_13885 [[Candidatus Thermochlorobacteriaceae] bacterium GBChlB]|nr:MAG: hypothetical protein HY22_13885 [[Candidatus Thermochlorobacteriaceae] bacterium GBChlB]